jgi:hexosaminidase
LTGLNAQNLNIIPKPQSTVAQSGYFDPGVEFPDIEVDGGLNAFNFEFFEFVKILQQIKPGDSKKESTVALVKDESISNDEGYRLEISKKRIQIDYKTDAGLFYALQTLKQLVSLNPEALPCVRIEDHPEFAYRGMHLDVGRHMFDVEYIKTYIDLIALHKMNRFHWHLTEDQGWRIEIKKYPRLTQVGAYRDATVMGKWTSRTTGVPPMDGKVYGGFYTQEEVKEVVAYAAKRHITVIPEIEMPGHALAAITSYPELGNFGEQYEVAGVWGVFPQIFAPSEQTFGFLEDVLTEVMALFPSEYIHIGGDEAPKAQWEKSEFAQKLIKEKGLKDEHELQSYFIQRIERFLNANGRQIIGWDEILEGGLAPNATVMSWRGESGGIEAAKAHHNVIMTPTDALYFDYYQSKPERNEPFAIGGFVSAEMVYNYHPIPEELSEEEGKYILGAQGNVWTEYMKTPEKVNYMVLPRMTALSEVVWSNPSDKNWDDFVERWKDFTLQYDALGVNYATHLFKESSTK